MKKIAIIACLLTFCSFPSLADSNGGFLEDKESTGYEQDYSKTANTARVTHVSVTTTANAKNLQNQDWVTLEGNIVKKTGEERYLFRDPTDSIEITVNDDCWGGQEVTSDDLVSISGKVTKKQDSIAIHVENIRTL